MSSHHQRRWNPWEEFEIYNSDYNDFFTCMGITTKGDRCQITISVSTRSANSIMDSLSMKEPSVRAMERDLGRIAKDSCCGRWHKNQADTIALRFKNIVASMERSSPAPGTNTSRAESSTATTNRHSTPTAGEAARPRQRNSNESRSAADRSAGGRSERRRTAPRLRSISPSPSIQVNESDTEDTLVENTRPEDSVSEQDTPSGRHHSADETLEAVVRAITEQVTAQLRDQGVHRDTRDNASRMDTSNEPRPTTAVRSAGVAEGRPSSQECTTRHVRRRAFSVNEECGICQEAMAGSLAQELVWCKSQCGKSLHKECFTIWQAMRPRQSQPLTCVYCRARWAEPCVHDTVIPSIRRSR